MSRAPRFEICHGDDGWWARFRAANGRVVWVTETYRRRRAAEDAVAGMVTAAANWSRIGAYTLTDIDERTQP